MFEAKLKPVARPPARRIWKSPSAFCGSIRRTHLQCAVAEAMTIHETSFFRDGKVFDVLRETILPRLIEANAATRRLRIWSAACSTGQEAYSVAMLLCEHFPALVDWDVKIVGTDSSSQVVEYRQTRALPGG